MPAFFVHGVPATHRLWNPIIENLSRQDIIAVDLPGFGVPAPDGFDASKEAYVAWLIERIEEVGSPVDLVGHDWGCMLSVRVASLRPDLIRSWAAGGGAVNADYEWHPLAKIFQSPGEGERYFDELDRDVLMKRMTDDGVSPDLAVTIVDHVDRSMGSCILPLYRSAITVGAEWEPDLARVSAPGLVTYGVRDHVCTVTDAERMVAGTQNARLLPVDAGHWFPLGQPRYIAKALEEHWASAV